MTVPGALEGEGPRVLVRTVRRADVEPYRRAVESSRERLSRWNPVDPGDLMHHLAAQSELHRTFLVLARDREGSHGVVGKINVVNVVRGRFCSAVLGYDAYDPYAGRGLFREGLSLVVDLALRGAAAGGMGLHRLEANVQPGNSASAGVLRSLGFRHEGETPRMLYLDGPGGERWRDHERYAVTAEEWPARPYAPHRRARRVVLVNGVPGPTSGLAAALAAELVLPLLGQDVVPEPVLWSVLGGCPTGAVVACWWQSADRERVVAGLRQAAVEPSEVVEVWCQGAPEPDRRPGRPVAPLSLGQVLAVDSSASLQPRAGAEVALQVRALAAGS